MSLRARAALTVIVAVGACEVGEPVVDRLSGRDAAVLDCPYIPACAADGGVEVERPIVAPCGGSAGCVSTTVDRLALPPLPVNPLLLRIEADGQGERRLSGIRLRNARLELVGPVALTIDGQSTLTNVELVLAADGGEPRVTMEDVELELVRVVAQGDEPLGELALSRVGASQVELVARHLHAHGSRFTSARLAASTLALADVDLSQVVLASDVAALAAVQGEDVATERCGSFTFARGNVTGLRSRLGPCTDVLRVYDAQVGLADLSGPVEADGADLSRVTLGARAPVSLDGFALKLSGARLCTDVGPLRFDDASALRCVSCEAPPARPPCRMASGPLTAVESDCPSFEPVDGDGLAQCAQPWSQSQRPL